jgi:transcriptional regulator with XRE-family HTH domain
MGDDRASSHRLWCEGGYLFALPAKKPGRPAPATLRLWRHHLGLTLEDVAIKLGVSYSAVAKWERGETPVDLETLRRLADAFGIEPGSLLLAPGIEGKFDLVEIAHRILETGDRENLEAWIEIGSRMFGIELPQRTGIDGPVRRVAGDSGHHGSASTVSAQPGFAVPGQTR